MAQEFNKYNGPSNQRIENTYGELTNSLIYPSPFHSNIQSGWPDPTGWQANGSKSYNAGNFYPGRMTGPNGYFPEQQNYVDFDEGDDFYNNGDEAIRTRPTGGQATRPEFTNQNTTDTQHSPMQRSSILPGAKVMNSKATEQNQNLGQSANTMSREDPSVMLGVLRARLLAKRPSGGKTPTPEPKSDKAGGSGETGKGNRPRDEKKQPSDELTTTNANQSSAEPAQTDTQKDDTLMVDSNTPSSQQPASGTDIDALFDEARAAEAAKKNKVTKYGDTQGTKNHVNGHGSKPTSKPEGAVSVSRQVEMPATKRRPSLANSIVSSEASEQGEIHEEPTKSGQSTEKKSPEHGLFKGGKEKPMIATEGKDPQLPPKPGLAKPEPQKLDTTITAGRKGGSELDSAKPNSPSSARTPINSRSKEARETLLQSDSREEYRRERFHESSRSNSDRRQDIDWDRPKERHQQSDAFRPPSRYRAEEAERAAAEYKRNLQLAKLEPRNVAQPSQSVEEPQALPNTTKVEQFDDVNEWLEMTGYFDKAYRKKAIVRHRKLIELDKQTAELVREGQVEHEERLHIARAQSLRPRESIESPLLRSNITPQGLPSISMPPPPLPTKDIQEDVGIQIKDLANRENATGNRRSEGDLRAHRQLHDSPVKLAPTVKRQYPEDGYGSPPSNHVDKYARTDSRDYSFDKKTLPSPKTTTRPVPTSLESRISVDNSSYKREYQARSRSPVSRRRSLTPPYRRTSGSEMQLVRQRSDSSRNGYSPPRRPDMSRDASPSRRDGGLSYDGPRDHSPPGRYNAYRSDYDNRSNSGYEPYHSSQRGGHYQNQQYQSPNYRGRGRGRGGRGGYYNHNRGGYKAYDRGGSEG